MSPSVSLLNNLFDIRVFSLNRIRLNEQENYQTNNIYLFVFLSAVFGAYIINKHIIHTILETTQCAIRYESTFAFAWNDSSFTRQAIKVMRSFPLS